MSLIVLGVTSPWGTGDPTPTFTTMSQYEPLTAYRTKPADTVHTETNDPALLALLQNHSTAAAGHKLHPQKSPQHAAPPKSSLPPQSTVPDPQHSLEEEKEAAESPINSVHYPITGGGSSTLPHRTNNARPADRKSSERPVDAPRKSLSQSSLQDIQADPLRNRSEDQFLGHSLSTSPVDRDYNLSASDSHSSDLAVRSPAPSRKSVALDPPAGHQATREFDDEADDEGGDTEDGGELDEGEDTLAANPRRWGGQPPYVRGSDRADERSVAGQQHIHPHPQQPPPAPSAAVAPAAISPGGRSGAASLPQSPRLDTGGSGGGGGVVSAASPRLADPDPQRFVAPYAARRLKDNHQERGAPVSVTVTDELGQRTLSVPKEENWSSNQVAKLKGREGSAANSLQGTGAPQGSDVTGYNNTFSQNRDQQTRDRERANFESADSLEFPSAEIKSHIQGQGLIRAPDVNYEEEDTLTHDNSLTRRSKGPHVIEEERIGGRKLQTTYRSDDRNTNSVTHHQSTEIASTGSAPGTPISILKKVPPELDSEVDRVYVESPGFTTEEEDKYRFVSSRIDDHEDYDRGGHATFRALDEQAVNAMDGSGGGSRSAKKGFKQVRYQDEEDRFEDRDKESPYAFGRGKDSDQEPFRSPVKERQYVLRTKSESIHSGSEQGRSQQEPHETPPRAKSLVLPSGPTYDPRDEEDLKREAYYQQELKDRVTTIQRQAEDTVVPRLPLSGRESEEAMYARDSLDIPDDFELDSERVTKGVHPLPRRDSLEVYEQHRLHEAMRNTHWGDPPAPPPVAAGHYRGVPPGYSNNPRRGYGQPQQGPGYDDDPGYDDRLAQQGYSGPPPRRDQGFERSPPLGPGFGNYRGRDHVQGEPARGYGKQGFGGAPPQRGYENQRPGHGDSPDPHSVAGGGYPDGYYADRQADSDKRHHGNGQPNPLFNTQRQGPGQGHYMERRAPQNYADAEPQEGFYLTEPRGYIPTSGGPIYSQDYEDDDEGHPVHFGNRNPNPNPAHKDEGLDTDRYQLEDPTQRMHHNAPPPPTDQSPPPTLPAKPAYDYVSHNKHDYGRPKKRNYTKIHEVKKDEEEKLAHIFIQPKVKGKKSHKASRDSSPSHYPAIAEDPGPDEAHGAEELWAQRSASLAIAKNTKLQGKRQPGSNTSSLGNSSQYHSDSSLPTLGQGRPPLKPIPAANSMQLVPVPTAQLSPTHSGFRGIDLQPISQQLITEDGQRISVDVNLRLISPNLGPGSEESGGYARHPAGLQRPTGFQYPVGNTRGEQPYSAPNENDIPRGRFSADDLFSPKGGGPVGRLAAGYMSDSNHDYNDHIYSTNPYKKIPPIAADSEAPRSAPTQGQGGSYMMSYLKEKEKMKSSDGGKPWYKVYGLSDYKRMQNEVKLGTRTLGPDLDNETFKERREKMQRQIDYAKAVKDRNTKEFVTHKPPSFPRPSDQQDSLSKRKLAVEYAKNVPKPTVRPQPNPFNNYEMASKMSPIAKALRGQVNSQLPDPSVEMLDLDKLHQRHQQDKRSAEIIRQKAQGMVS